MSSSSETSEFSDLKAAKSPEQSTFSQTCSLLSQYLKEKGSFGDLSLGITCNIEGSGSPETTCHSAAIMNLLPAKTPQNLTPMNSSVIKSVSKEPKAAQLTIFYGGQVVVFDDFPAEKAKEIMSFASKGVSQSQNRSAYPCNTQNQSSFPPNLVTSSADSSAPIHHPNVNIVHNAANNLVPEHPQASPRPVIGDLPIARKASLHRFLEKRKDRIAARAPYQTSNLSKPAEPMPWIGLSPNSPQI